MEPFPMAKGPLKVLFIGSDEYGYLLVHDCLRKMKQLKSTLDWIPDFNQGAERLLSRHYDVCLLDCACSPKRNFELLRKAARNGCSAPIIMLSDGPQRGLDIKSMELGATDYLIKTEIDSWTLERSIRYSIIHKKKEAALRTSKRTQQNAREKLEKIVQSINEEMETAQKVQELMLPRQSVKLAGLTLATAFLPCGRIGGDLYDVIKIDDSTTCFLMFDVVGHGIPAALISAMVKFSFCKNITPLAGTAEILEKVNKEILDFFKERHHITAFIALYNTLTREMTFTGAGHPPPIVVRNGTRHLENLSSRGLPIGMFPEIAYEVSRVQLKPGDWIVFYTDGLTEGYNAKHTSFGKTRLESVLADLPEDWSPEDVLGAIIESQFSFRGTAARSDDITIVVAKVS
jgi:sigma-B regulation protein RsbU (phosphoserine phosphatase)